MLKVLAIGNSFSQDATAMLENLGEGLYVRNLYIGGCSLMTHAKNAVSGERAYDYEMLGSRIYKTTIKEALMQREWDVITLQQVSGDSGIEETFYPYITELIALIRQIRPNAEIRLHRTWAYEFGSTHPRFADYGCDRDRMWQSIYGTYNAIGNREGLKIIPAGDFIQYLRTVPEFNKIKGGLDTCRDGFHIAHGFGRYALALTWWWSLTGQIPTKVPSNVPTELADKVRGAFERFIEEYREA